MQNCTTIYSPAPSHFTPDRENTRPKHPKAIPITKRTCWPISNQIRAPKAKIAHPTGSLYINHNYNLTEKNSQIQQDSNNTGNDHDTITYNSTGLHCPNLTFKRAPGAEKSHCWTFVQNCTTVYSPAPSHFTPDRENTRPKHPKAIPFTKRTCWPISSQIRGPKAKIAIPTGSLHINYN